MYDVSYRLGDSMCTNELGPTTRSGFLEAQGDCDGYDVEGTHDLANEETSEVAPGEFFVPPGYHNGSVLRAFRQNALRGLSLGVRALERGKLLFYHQRECVQMGEGPTILRLLCFLGGLALLTSSLLSMINILSLFTGPSTYVLQMYQGFFGIITMIVEAKDWDCLDQFKPWMVEWFRFLTVPAGKGAFYIFIGSLGVSLWVRNLLAFTVGLYMASMGLICVAVHAGTSRKPSDQRMYSEEIAERPYALRPMRYHRSAGSDALVSTFRDAEMGDEERYTESSPGAPDGNELLGSAPMRRDMAAADMAVGHASEIVPSHDGPPHMAKSGRKVEKYSAAGRQTSSTVSSASLKRGF